MNDFQQSDKGGMAIDDIIIIFVNMVCFKEVQFEYRGGFANNIGRMKIKGVVIFPVGK